MSGRICAYKSACANDNGAHLYWLGIWFALCRGMSVGPESELDEDVASGHQVASL